MHKKIILAVVTLMLGLAAYAVFTRGDRRVVRSKVTGDSEAVRQFVSRPTSQASQSISDAEMRFSPGETTQVKVYDEISGRLKYVFKASKWEPISETEFHLKDLAIQLYMPRGETTYIEAPEANVTLARKGRNRVDPKRGHLKGPVKITLDRSTTKWREENPDRADRDSHPEDLIHITLGDARFDMDRAELFADGDVVLDSEEGRIDNVRGLTVQWDQVDNRIDILRFAQGGRMLLRRGGRMVDFGMPGSLRQNRDKAKRNAAAQAAGAKPGAALAFNVPRAQAMHPTSIESVTAAEAAAEIRTEGGTVATNRPRRISVEDNKTPAPASQPGNELRNPEALAADVETLRSETRSAIDGAAIEPGAIEAEGQKERRRIHTYRAVFAKNVVVEQLDGGKTIGRLDADKLEVNFDFGRKQRETPLGGAGAKANRGSAASQPAAEPARTSPLDDPQDSAKLTLTWNGPLEMRPIRVDPAEQSGQRFDAVAIGNPVKLKSEQGNATCDQLVYRHERRQAWLSGNADRPVEMSVDASRRLIGREIFFDQKRGLARIDGAGTMIDERGEGSIAPPGLMGEPLRAEPPTPKTSKDAKPRPPVKVQWTRGVDLELGTRAVQVINPESGQLQEKKREYLRRAWFHGDVMMRQGEELLSGEEVAITFGQPVSGEEVADHIQHLNMSGSVRLSRLTDSLSGDRLDVQMTVTPDGRNVPHVVDASGGVIARQGPSEIQAGEMHVVLGMAETEPQLAPDGKTMIPGKMRVAMESVKATGNVFIRDPQLNLKISKAESLTASLRGANRLTRATIVSKDPSVMARARYADVAIHGHRIEINLDEQSIDVPGPGKAFMVTKEDFGGRKLTGPTVVRTSWQEKMQLRTGQNYGVFLGKVSSTSDFFDLNCDKMTVRFAKAPPVEKVREDEPSRKIWLLGPILGDKGEVRERDAQFAVDAGERKRPTYIVAEGNAQATYLLTSPTATDQRGRLTNRMYVDANQIAADLTAQQMSVPCEGSLLIEDYEFNPKSIRKEAAQSRTSPLMSSLSSEGPSQTMVTWRNSMDYFVDSGMVVFDKDVKMIHRSGRKMVMQKKLASAMRLSDANLAHLGKGREAQLTCGNLMIELQKTQKAGNDSDQSLVRETDLERLIARGTVYLQEGTRSLMGEHLQYLRVSGELRLEGSGSLEARIIDQAEGDQRFSMWKGPLLIWDRNRDRIEAPQATIRTSRR